MLNRNIFLLILTIALSLSACKKEDDLFVTQPDKETYQETQTTIAPAFDVYVQRFIEEGKARGLNIDLESKNITIQFTNINQQESPNVVGMCSYDGRFHNDITIDIAFWGRASGLQKEFILFHELGHCYLYRGHRSDALSNGTCASIMRGAEPGCTDAYNAATRNYYINELFSLFGDR